MSSIQATLGAMLIGFFLNTHLFGFVTYQYISYFKANFKDPLWVKSTVALLFLNDTVYTASLIYMAWVYCVQNFMNPAIFLTVLWPYSYTPIAMGISAVLTHQFLVFRASRLMKNRIIYIGIMMLSAGTFASAMAGGIKSWTTTDATKIKSLKVYLYVWLALQTVTDIIVSSTLAYALYRSRTGFEQTDHVIFRLIRGAVQTGLTVVVFALAHLIAFIVDPETLVYTVFASCTGRMYSITLMDTLHCRSELRDLLAGPIDITTSMVGKFSQSRAAPTSYQLSDLSAQPSSSADTGGTEIKQRHRIDMDLEHDSMFTARDKDLPEFVAEELATNE